MLEYFPILTSPDRNTPGATKAFGSICGTLPLNCDKFAIQRKLPEIDMGDLIVIHDTGAHGHSMGYNYNGRLRHQEIMVHEDGSVQQIRRNETLFDLFATLDFPSLKENTAKVEK